MPPPYRQKMAIRVGHPALATGSVCLHIPIHVIHANPRSLCYWRVTGREASFLTWNIHPAQEPSQVRSHGNRKRRYQLHR